MTEDEKTKYLQQKREKDLTAREAAVTRKELMAEAKKSQERKRKLEQSGQYIDSQDKTDTKRKC